jgi:hypothetical protein
MYMAPRPHYHTGRPTYGVNGKRIEYPIGSIWRCECGQYFKRCFTGRSDSLGWKKIGRRRAERILRKVGES